MPDVVLRPRSAARAVTLGPAFVSVTDGAKPPRSFPRDAGKGARGAVARLRAHLVDERLTPALPQISRLSLLDGRGAVLVAVPWDGADHDTLEAGCAAAGVALDRVPEQPPDGVGEVVVLPAPSGSASPTGAAARRGAGVTLVLGRRDVTVDGTPGGRLRWPRLGCAPEHEPAVARLRVTLFAEHTVHDPELLPGPPQAARQRVFGLTLLGVDGRPMAYLQWGTHDLPALRRACAVAGVLPEFRWQPYGEAAAMARRGVPVVQTAAPLPAAQPRHDRWLYGVAVLVLVALAVAVAILSAH